jgi:hypothetical protein
MTDLTIRQFSNVEDVDTDTLKQELARALEVTAENMVWLARLWRELERRGEDLRELRTGLRTFLPLIADGRLDAQAAVQFSGHLMMLRTLATMPIEEQRRLAAGGTIPVVVIRDGEPITRRLKADDISTRMIKQVFAPGRIRSEDEQRVIVTTLQPERAKREKKYDRIKFDADKVIVWRRLAERKRLTLEGLIESALRPLIDAESK